MVIIHSGSHEEGVEVPYYEQLEPEALQTLIQEFVTRDGNDWGDVDGALKNKVGQVMQQLRNRKAMLIAMHMRPCPAE